MTDIVERLKFASEVATSNGKECLASLFQSALVEIEDLRAAAVRVINKHDSGSMSKAPGDSLAIESLRTIVSSIKKRTEQ